MAEHGPCDEGAAGGPRLAVTRRALTASIAALSLSPRAAEAAVFDAKRVSKVLGAFVGSDRHGLSAAVVLPDGRVLAAASAPDDRRPALTPETPLTPETSLPAGASARTFCAVLIMSLVEAGQLDLDAPLAPLFRDEAWFARLPNQDLSLRILLANREGFPDWRDHPEVQGALAQARRTGRPVAWSPRETLAFVLDRPPLAPAGAAFRPSELAYDLVGVALEKATGRGYYDLMEERVLSRLPGATVRPASGREIDPHAERPAYTFGGLTLTATDLAGFHRRLARGEIVSAPSLTQMQPSGAAAKHAGNAYGLGLAVDHGPDGRTRAGHFGDCFPATAEAAHCLGSGITLAVLTRAPSGSGRLDALQTAVMATLRA
jgi:D-alanyl-D-alanine carboxypeptidase